jgi:CBS domain containing-hemolysin-like protein
VALAQAQDRLSIEMCLITGWRLVFPPVLLGRWKKVIDIILGSVAIGALLLVEAFLALARAAFVNSHPAKLKSLQEEAVSRAELAVRIATDASRLILSLRAALTISRLFLIGLALATYAMPVYLDGQATWIAMVGLLLAIGLIMGLVEFFAETVALRDPEHWAVRLAPIVAIFEAIFAPVGWLLLRSAGWITGASGERAHPMVTEAEIMTLVDAGEEEGVIEEDEKAMIYSIFQLADTLAREVMVPRIDMLAIEDNTSLIDATEALLKTGYSRAPVYSDTVDNIIGLLYAKDLLAAWRRGGQHQPVANLCREAFFVPEAKMVDDLLAEMQAKRVHMAVVVDEYGGTAGLVTIEDVVEEIVGEIRDEYDFAEELRFQVLQEGEFLFSGGIDVDDVNQLTQARLPKETSETLGGFIYGKLGKVPAVGETVDAGGLQLTVEEISGRRISKVRARRLERSAAESIENENNNETT